MKKIVFFALAACAVLSSVSAQKGEFHLSIQAAPQFAWLSAPNDATIVASGTQVGLGIGVHGDYYFSERYALTVGLVFLTNAGGTLTYNKSDQMYILPKSTLSNSFQNAAFGKGTKITYRNQYLELPIGLKLHTEEVNGMRFFGNIPVLTLAFRTQSQADIYSEKYTSGTTTSIVPLNLVNESIGTDMSVFNFYVGGGAGVEYRLGETTTLIGGLFYQHGLIDATNNFKYINAANAEANDDSNAQLSGISLRVGIMF